MTKEREAMERGPNYDWSGEVRHYRDECDSLRELLRTVERSGDQIISQLRTQLTQAQADCLALREALHTILKEVGTSTLANKIATQALTTHTAGAELLKELEGLRELESIIRGSTTGDERIHRAILALDALKSEVRK